MLSGSILAGALLASIPVYTQGLLQRYLQDEMESFYRFNGYYPGAYVARQQFVKDLFDDAGRADYHEYRERLYRDFIPEVGLPVSGVTERLIVSYLRIRPEGDGATGEHAVLEALENLTDHVNLVAGRAYKPTSPGGVVEVVVTEAAYNRLHLELEATYELGDTRARMQVPMIVRVVGVIAPADLSDRYWHHDPDDFDLSLFMDHPSFDRIFIDARSDLFSGAEWHIDFDYTKIHIRDIRRLLRTIENHTGEFRDFEVQSYEIRMVPLLTRYLAEESSIRRLFLLLETPVVLLLFLYIVVVSRFFVNRDKNEIALLKSRGASDAQVLKLYGSAGILLASAAIVCGPPLALLISSALGSVDGFLAFVGRDALDLRLGAQAYLYACIGACLFITATIVPVIRASRTTIVVHKRRAARTDAIVRWSRSTLR